jgi:hypothetical protein
LPPLSQGLSLINLYIVRHWTNIVYYTFIMVVLNFRVIKEIQEDLDPLDQKGLKDQ